MLRNEQEICISNIRSHIIIGYVDLDNNEVIGNIKDYQVFKGGLSKIYKKTPESIVKNIYMNKNKTKYIKINKNIFYFQNIKII